MADKNQKLAELVARAKELASKDDLTPDEQAEAQTVMVEAKALHEVIQKEAALGTFANDMSGKVGTPVPNEGDIKQTSSLFDAFKKAGWAPNVKAVVPAHVAVKDATWDGNVDEISPDRREGVALGADERRL